MLLGSQHAAAQRMVAEGGDVDQLAGHRRGLVLVALERSLRSLDNTPPDVVILKKWTDG
jgi:hypothetical protein